ncbi:MAG: monooxygenase YjiB [Ktedonobacteraceae bacterium]
MPTPAFVTDFTLPPMEWHRRMRDWSQEMRQSQPVAYDEQLAGWRLFRHDDIVRMQSDYQTFSSEPAGSGEGFSSIIALDPPRHRQLRSLVTPAFSARSIAQLAPRVKHLAAEVLEPLLAQGHLDMIVDFANPFPVMVVADLLGLPRIHWPRVKQWTDALMAVQDLAATNTENGLRELPITEMYTVMAQTIAEHRQQPQDDLLSLLLAAEIDGQHMTESELFGFFITLLVAGNITTTQLLGNAMLCFDEHPEAWQQLRQDPGLVTGAVEEILRYLPPNRGTGGDRIIIGGRLTTRNTQIGSQAIRAGEEVYVTTISANFDEQQFPHPERFDISRAPNRHISFGHGIHFCLGAPLARLETKIALELLLAALPTWRIASETYLRQIRNHVVFGVQYLPIVFPG